MSLEQAIKENTEAVNRLAAGFVAFVDQVSRVASPAAAATAPPAGPAPTTTGGETLEMTVDGSAAPPAAGQKRKRRTKAEIEADEKAAAEAAGLGPEAGSDEDPAVKETAKAKCAELAEKLGKEKLAFLFSCFGAKKFSDVKPGAGVYADMISRADAMLSETAPAADDDDAGADDILGDEPAEEKPPATFEDVKAAFEKMVAHPDLGRADVIAILTDLGAARLPDLDKAKYNEAIARAEAAVKKVSAE